MCHYDILRPLPGIKRYFHVQRFCFSCVFLNVLSLDRTIISQFKFWSLMLAQVLLCFPILLYAIDNIQDLDKATDSLVPFWEIVTSVFKVLLFMWNSKKIITVIQTLWLWNCKAKGEEYEILAEENRKDVIFCTFYYISACITGLMALLSPLMVACFYARQGEDFWEYLEAPAKASYFINIKSVLGYTVVYIWNTSCAYYLVYSSISTDSIYSWYICNISGHFRILKYRLRQAGNQNNGNCSNNTIYECIAYHTRILELVNDFNSSFRVVVFINCSFSCALFCCLAFQLTRNSELMQLGYMGSFLVAVSVQLLLYSYGGQRLQDESESVASEIYESFHWELLAMDKQKLLLFSMRRSQDACNVSGIFFTANLRLFLLVYRIAASFISLLLTLEEKENVTK